MWVYEDEVAVADAVADDVAETLPLAGATFPAPITEIVAPC